MCGIVGVVSSIGWRPTPERVVVERLRDLMRHRGPDGAGYAESGAGHVRFGHRRLAVVDLSEHGRQPWCTADGSLLVYNGELYNDSVLRRALSVDAEGEHAGFRSTCDTETLSAALRRWGVGAIPTLRGMFAFAWYDAARERLVLARDPLGIKPLYWAKFSRGANAELAFASEIAPLLQHPLLSAAPDLATVSSYLTTIRTTLGGRTLFRGVRAVMPGEVIEFDLRTATLVESSTMVGVHPWEGGWTGAGDGGEEFRGVATGSTREVVVESIDRHLRSDVPLCSLLSGGLDSTILASVTRRRVGKLRTYAAGAQGSDAVGGDLEWARAVSAELGTTHAEAVITRQMFTARWRELVEAAAVPLSTPNEVAINEVARMLASGGHVVALSGEGADELFGGYEAPMANAAMALAAAEDGVGGGGRGPDGGHDGGLWQLGDAAWIPPEVKLAVLREDVRSESAEDSLLVSEYRRQFSMAVESAEHAASRVGTMDGGGRMAVLAGRGEILLAAHLQFARRINLAGLLLRLDSATMRAGVEGRTPFADVVVARHAELLPMELRFDVGGAPGPARTKIALRRAFGEEIPEGVLSRPKASFPLPFQEWVADCASILRQSGLAREIFTPAAIAMVGERPRELWRLAWPMINIAMWGERW